MLGNGRVLDPPFPPNPDGTLLKWGAPACLGMRFDVEKNERKEWGSLDKREEWRIL